MKYLLIVFIVLAFGLIGYNQKLKIIRKKKLIETIRDYVYFYDANLSVFKTDLISINNEFIIMHFNKSANNIEILIKNNNIYQFNYNFIKNTLSNIAELNLILNYLQTIGNLDYEFEKSKNAEILILLNRLLQKLTEDIKAKGDLFFKVILSIGAVIAILLW